MEPLWKIDYHQTPRSLRSELLSHLQKRPLDYVNLLALQRVDAPPAYEDRLAESQVPTLLMHGRDNCIILPQSD
ncbi:hypothetical protein [Thermogemmatispora tikiterensis]|nr:hypothetical protein [Thermogemmatispora tikiterensis]